MGNADTSRNGPEPEQTAGQRALEGHRLRLRGFTLEAAARMSGASQRQIQSVTAVLKREPSFEALLESGEIALNAALTGAGYRTGKHVAPGRAFGKGDKWPEVAHACLQFLGAWQARDYKFTHVPPREADKRIAAIDEIVEGLQACRADLVNRSVRATSALPNK